MAGALAAAPASATVTDIGSTKANLVRGIAESGRTRAEDLLGHYDSDWNGDVTRVFRDFAF